MRSVISSIGIGFTPAEWSAAPIDIKQGASSGNTAFSSVRCRVRTNARRRPFKKWSGPPRKSTLPFILLPCARPDTVWSTTAWKIEADMSCFFAPWLMRG